MTIRAKEETTARTPATVVLASAFIVVAVLLGVYAAGVFDNNGPRYTDQMEYDEGDFSFSGYLKDGYFDGHGMITFQNGDAYYGGFAEGRFDGEATYLYSGEGGDDSWRFDGIFESGQILSGVFNYSDGTAVSYESASSADSVVISSWQYIGGLNERGQNGTGRFIYEDGSVYIGDFMAGSAMGEGTYINAAGVTVYTGEFLNGYFDGQGAYYSPSGWTYAGGFRNGLFSGEGQLTIGETVIRGVWEEGVQTTRYE